MKIRLLIFSFFIAFGSLLQAQNETSVAQSHEQQADKFLARKEYINARYQYKTACSAYAAQGDYAKAVECGIKANSLFVRDYLYKEAFELCKEMELQLSAGEKKQKTVFYDLRYQIVKERVQMYTAIKSAEQSRIQIGHLEEVANASKNPDLMADLLYTKANYYYAFGQFSQGDQQFKRLIAQYKERKEYDKVSQCYRELIALARKNGNIATMDRSYQNWMVWADSARILTAQDQLDELQQKYDSSLETISDKEDSLRTQKRIIGTLVTLIVILAAALAAALLILSRFILSNRRLKKNVAIANEHNDLKTKFIRNISLQMEPTLQNLSASAARITEAEAGTEIQQQINALEKFSGDIQELSELENSLSELYPTETIQPNAFCESVMDKVRDRIKPGVTATVNAINMPVKTNAQQLEKILLHLLDNAAACTETGRITLEYRKRGAHTYQFVVTDNGPGISAERQENLFKPFAEIRDLTSDNGLALPICALIAVKMNGSLTLDPTYTRGSRFVVEIHA
ncbi:MAG: HAMP domain-containing histidine kinase [Coprobacter sp.]|nr:HAMP domain-containing histidine kinase [Coprobacter sp.]